MTEEAQECGENAFDLTSTDIERFYALNSVLAEVDDLFESVTFKKTDFVKRILDLFPDENQKECRKEKIGIDFSSPNIAKPFHVGHLRSTFIGRALANLAISNGSDVVRINYLGDWGTQFGLLAMAHETFSNDQSDFEVANSSDSSNLAANRMRHYFNLYVKANERAEADPEFRQKALDYFARLENGGDQTALQFWRRVVDDSVRDLKALYSRLGIAFDAWESEHAAAIPAKALVEELEKRGVLQRTDDNLLGVHIGHGDDARLVPLTKSDGATLYLTRDVHTAIYRSDQLGCTRLFYVTDRSQGLHFRELKEVLRKIGRSDVAEKIVHVKFGRVLGMSTRKGNAVFVDDVLDDGIKRAEDDVLKSDANTKTPAGTPERRQLGEQLTLSCLVINDLRDRLAQDYEFDWRRILETKMDGGVALQKSFCRLSSVCERRDVSVPDFETFRRSMTEKQATDLIAHVSRRLAPALRKSLNQLELYPLTRHLFKMRKFCGAAARHLRAADAPTPALRSSRFLLFDTARRVLGLGLRLLGAKPLAKI